MRFIVVISAHRFEAIFCCRFGQTFSKDVEKFRCFASENIPDFHAPTLKWETLILCDKLCEGMCPKMFTVHLG